MDLAAIKDELRTLLAAAPDGPPWIRKWESLDVHGMRGDGVLTNQRNIDLAVAAVNALPLLADSPSVEPCGEPVALYGVAYGEQYDPCAKAKGHAGNHDPSRPSVEPPNRDADIARIATALDSLDDEHITSHRLGIAAALYDAGLRPSVEPPCEHEWEDAPDDEEAWYCPKCGAREEPEQRADETGWLRPSVEPAGPAPITVEQRVELARAMGRMQAEQEAVQAIGKIVMAAGGEVRVPDNLLVKDVTVSSDFVNGATIYRALLPTQASDSPEYGDALHAGAHRGPVYGRPPSDPDAQASDSPETP